VAQPGLSSDRKADRNALIANALIANKAKNRPRKHHFARCGPSRTRLAGFLTS